MTMETERDSDRDDRLLAYMQDRLAPEDRAAFEEELAQSPSLQAEVAILRAAADQLGATPVPEGARAEGWQRLSASIAQEQRGTPANTNRILPLLKVAAIAAVAITCWQLAVVPRLSPGDGFRPASVTPAGPALRVAFAPDAPLSQVTALLAETGAQISEGPSALGLYTLSFPDAAARDSAEALLASLGALVIAVTRP